MGDVIAWPNEVLPERWIERLFEKMLAFYGSKFADQWRGSDPVAMKKVWAQELGRYSEAEITRGVSQLVTLDWPPSLPQFLRLCRPTIDPLVAYYEAVNGVVQREKGEVGTWSHPAIFYAARPLSYDLKNMTYSQIKPRWEKALADEMAKGSWPEIPAPALALSAPGQAFMSKEEAARRLDELGAASVIKPSRDYKRWARDIKERQQKGDQTLTSIQIQFATEALEKTA